MKNLLFLGLLAGLLMFNSCKDDEEQATEPDYHVHIDSPDATDKSVGDTLHISINFEDHNEGEVHHINVRIYNKDNGTEVYNEPADAHVSADKSFLYEDDFVLAVDPNTHWVLEGKVWGHDDGVSEVVESVEFHVQ